jgi:hypothetical protein
VIASCAIITTTANELLASVHDLICTNSVKAFRKGLLTPTARCGYRFHKSNARLSAITGLNFDQV